MPIINRNKEFLEEVPPFALSVYLSTVFCHLEEGAPSCAAAR